MSSWSPSRAASRAVPPSVSGRAKAATLRSSPDSVAGRTRSASNLRGSRTNAGEETASRIVRREWPHPPAARLFLSG